MADEEENEDPQEEDGEGLDEEAEGEEDEDFPAPEGNRKKILLLIGGVMILVAGGMGGAWYTGVLDPLIGSITSVSLSSESGGEEASPEDAFFLDLPDMLVNLNTSGRKSTFLKIRVSLELRSKDDQARIESLMPRIIDNFQVYLRELRVEDLKGSAGMYRLREELLTRVSAAASPTTVYDVLFREMLIQ